MKLNGLNILVGSDPELFVKDGNEYVSGHKLIEGTKEEPFPVRGGAIQVDGTALEFNTKPARGAKEFSNTVAKVVSELEGYIPRRLKLVANPTAEFAEKYFNDLPEKAKELGCDPDYNAYTGEKNETPDAKVTFRTGAGHVHIGWTDVKDPYNPLHMDECRAIIQAMDVFLGVPSILIDGDNKRRELYGKAGAFRPKTYGVEYRVLSNFWVMDDELRQWVFNNSMLALRRLLSKHHPLEKHNRWAVGAINNSDQHLAEETIKRFDVPLPKGIVVPKAELGLGWIR